MLTKNSLKAIAPVYVTYNVFKYYWLQLQILGASLRETFQRPDVSGTPVPPPRLRYRVHGALDRYSFLAIGKGIADTVRHLCTRINFDLASCERILDFGCGSGRVLRNFQIEQSTSQFYGTDIDGDLIRWCQQVFPDVHWSTNGYLPPLPFADNTFDLIYGISVFTHLDEAFQHAWLKELQRVAAPNALIILSVHGEYVLSFLDETLQQEVHQQGFKYHATMLRGRLKLDGLPDFYQSAYHTKAYIYQTWSAYFEIVDYVEQGINQHQDAVLLRKG